MTTAKDLRSMSKQDLSSKLIELRKEMIKHNAQISTGTTPKSPGQIREIKKTIAKIMTIVGTRGVPKLEDSKSSSAGTQKQEESKPSAEKKSEECKKEPPKKTE